MISYDLERVKLARVMVSTAQICNKDKEEHCIAKLHHPHHKKVNGMLKQYRCLNKVFVHGYYEAWMDTVLLFGTFLEPMSPFR